jgi:hypothetical protein
MVARQPHYYWRTIAFLFIDRTASAVSHPVLIGRPMHVKSIRGRTDERMSNCMYRQLDAAVTVTFMA